MMRAIAYTLISWFSAVGAAARIPARPPEADLSNSTTRLKVYLPEPGAGFYQGTRFDWSGVIANLESQGHSYFGQWFSRVDPNVHDFVYDGKDIVAGPCTAATGPVEEFTSPLGFDEAKPGGTFVKIGVGVLRKPDAAKYDSFRLYQIADAGHWQTSRRRDALAFRQEIKDPSSGYGYVYRKTLQLVDGAPRLMIEHQLKNTGSKVIHTEVYDHNFLVMDGQAPGPGLSVKFPFEIKPVLQPDKKLAAIRGEQILLLKTLKAEDRVYGTLSGFGPSPDDYAIRVKNKSSGAALEIRGHRPLSRVAVWSIRSVFAVEPFVDISVEPGETATWSYVYTFGSSSSSSEP